MHWKLCTDTSSSCFSLSRLPTSLSLSQTGREEPRSSESPHCMSQFFCLSSLVLFPQYLSSFSNPLLILLPCFSFPFLLGEKAPAFVYCKVLLAYGADLKGFQECKCTSVFAYPMAKRAAAKLILFLSPKGPYVFLHLLLLPLRLH